MSAEPRIKDDPAGGEDEGEGEGERGGSSSAAAASGEGSSAPGKLGRPKKVLLKISSQIAGVDQLNVRVKMTTKWNKVFEAFGKHAHTSAAQMRFLYDGERIDPEETAQVGELINDISAEEAEDGVQIDVRLEQLGGASQI